MTDTPAPFAARLAEVDALIDQADGIGQITSADAPYNAVALAAISAARQARALIADMLPTLAVARAADAQPEAVEIPGTDGVFVRPTCYRVAALPPHHGAERYVGLDVVQVGPDKWEVRHGVERLRPADGAGDRYDAPAADVDYAQWLASFRVPFDQALAAAARLAPTVVTSNQRAADFLRMGTAQ